MTPMLAELPATGQSSPRSTAGERAQESALSANIRSNGRFRDRPIRTASMDSCLRRDYRAGQKKRPERALVFSDSETLSDHDLFPESASRDADAPETPLTLEAHLADAEKAYLCAVLEAHSGRVTAAAAALGISRKTLWEKMRRYGLRFTVRDEGGESQLN